MSTPITPAQLLIRAKKFGVPVHANTVRGIPWTEHNRNGHGSFSDVHGVMIHHTGDDATDDADFRVLWNGRSDLPGPLCHVGIRDNGTVELISSGRANHAGIGDAVVLDRVIAENYGDAPPKPRSDSVDGNANFYGAELMYSGSHAPTDAQLRSAVSWAACLCDFHGWNEKSVIGHKEWTRRKVDPGGITMTHFRELVRITLATKG